MVISHSTHKIVSLLTVVLQWLVSVDHLDPVLFTEN